MGNKSIRPGYWHEGHYLAAQPAAPETERRLREVLAILDVIDGIVDDTHPEGDGCPLCAALDDLRAAIEAGDAQPAAPETERLREATWFEGYQAAVRDIRYKRPLRAAIQAGDDR